MRTIREPSREIPVVAEVDVLVAGGGPAGIAASVAAARLGASTMLVERYGYLGGMATGGLVLYMDSVFDKDGERCIGGIHWEMLERLRAMGGLGVQSPTRLHVDSELLKPLADEMVEEAGATLRLHSWAVDAWVEDSAVKGAIVESKSGRQAILARICVDATGDGDIAAQAGADFDLRTMRVGLNLKVGGVNRDAFLAWQRENPDEAKALRNRVLGEGGVPMGVGTTPYSDKGVYWVNVRGLATRNDRELDAKLGDNWNFSGQLNIVDVEDLTYIEVELRKRLLIGLDFYRKHVPGYEDVRLLMIAPQLGVRDSRRVRGVHTLTRDEAESGVFADAVGMTGLKFEAGHHLTLPYRALVPEKVDGLLSSGRCISVDDRLIGPIRIIPPCMVTGQAAGTAAAMSLKAGVAPRDLDVVALQKQLAADGVLMP